MVAHRFQIAADGQGGSVDWESPQVRRAVAQATSTGRRATTAHADRGVGGDYAEGIDDTTHTIATTHMIASLESEYVRFLHHDSLVPDGVAFLVVAIALVATYTLLSDAERGDDVVASTGLWLAVAAACVGFIGAFTYEALLRTCLAAHSRLHNRRPAFLASTTCWLVMTVSVQLATATSRDQAGCDRVPTLESCRASFPTYNAGCLVATIFFAKQPAIAIAAAFALLLSSIAFDTVFAWKGSPDASVIIAKHFFFFALAATSLALNVGRDIADRERFMRIAQSHIDRLCGIDICKSTAAVVEHALPRRLAARVASNPRALLWDSSENATVCVTAIHDFESWSMRRRDIEAAQAMHHFFTLFDAAVPIFGVDEATTFGDSYYITCGLLSRRNTAEHAIRFALWQNSLKRLHVPAHLHSAVVTGRLEGGLPRRSTVTSAADPTDRSSLRYLLVGPVMEAAVDLLRRVPHSQVWACKSTCESVEDNPLFSFEATAADATGGTAFLVSVRKATQALSSGSSEGQLISFAIPPPDATTVSHSPTAAGPKPRHLPAAMIHPLADALALPTHSSRDSVFATIGDFELLPAAPHNPLQLAPDQGEWYLELARTALDDSQRGDLTLAPAFVAYHESDALEEFSLRWWGQFASVATEEQFFEHKHDLTRRFQWRLHALALPCIIGFGVYTAAVQGLNTSTSIAGLALTTAVTVVGAFASGVFAIITYTGWASPHLGKVAAAYAALLATGAASLYLADPSSVLLHDPLFTVAIAVPVLDHLLLVQYPSWAAMIYVNILWTVPVSFTRVGSVGIGPCFVVAVILSVLSSGYIATAHGRVRRLYADKMVGLRLSDAVLHANDALKQLVGQLVPVHVLDRGIAVLKAHVEDDDDAPLESHPGPLPARFRARAFFEEATHKLEVTDNYAALVLAQVNIAPASSHHHTPPTTSAASLSAAVKVAHEALQDAVSRSSSQESRIHLLCSQNSEFILAGPFPEIESAFLKETSEVVGADAANTLTGVDGRPAAAGVPASPTAPETGTRWIILPGDDHIAHAVHDMLRALRAVADAIAPLGYRIAGSIVEEESNGALLGRDGLRYGVVGVAFRVSKRMAAIAALLARCPVDVELPQSDRRPIVIMNQALHRRLSHSHDAGVRRTAEGFHRADYLAASRGLRRTVIRISRLDEI